MINSTDLFATIANIAGVKVSEVNDSQSFNELLSNSEAKTRDYIYSEAGESATLLDVTIRNNTHKYIQFSTGSEAFYNLSIDPLETINLLNSNRLPLSDSDKLIKEELVTKLLEIRN